LCLYYIAIEPGDGYEVNSTDKKIGLLFPRGGGGGGVAPLPAGAGVQYMGGAVREMALMEIFQEC